MSPVRVSQSILFNSFITNMNNAVTELMELNTKASAQKKITTPSDDAAGSARVLNFREAIDTIEQYRENVDTAKGWLGVADSSLLQVNTVLTRVKELAEQAATGTMSAQNRKQVGFEVRALFNQLINLSNTEFEGKHIFAGHKVDQPAFQTALRLTTNDSAFDASHGQGYTISGDLESTAVVQFLDDAAPLSGGEQFRYSLDGGQTWTTSTVQADPDGWRLELGGAVITLPPGTEVQAVDTGDFSSQGNGTWLWVRPTAEYIGDDEDQQTDAFQVDSFAADTSLDAYAQGVFRQNVTVRVDTNLDDATPNTVTAGETLQYSYSLDGGLSWETGNTTSVRDPRTTLQVPGGLLILSDAGGPILRPGEQFVIRPRRGAMHFEISPGETLAVNSVGKEIFGGIYQAPGSSNATAAFGGGAKNMFEVVGKLVGYIETNNQHGIQEALESLREASEHVMTKAASVGGRENRLNVAENVLSQLELNNSERLSKIEDVDVAELMTQLAQQQLVYESVLKSSSMIMRLNLTSFI
jgi:flagellar hook-associated protein 3 FlgL